MKAHVTDRVRKIEEEWNECADGCAKEAMRVLKDRLSNDEGYLRAKQGRMWNLGRLLSASPVAGVCYEPVVPGGRLGGGNGGVKWSGSALELSAETSKRMLRCRQDERLWNGMVAHVHQGNVLRVASRDFVQSVVRDVPWGVRRFFVRAVCQRLPCGVVQKERKLRESSLCPRCGILQETVEHMFDCDFEEGGYGTESCEQLLWPFLSKEMAKWPEVKNSDNPLLLCRWRDLLLMMNTVSFVSGAWSREWVGRLPEEMHGRLKKIAREVLMKAYEWYRGWTKVRFK